VTFTTDFKDVCGVIAPYIREASFVFHLNQTVIIERSVLQAIEPEYAPRK
jgi:hypothetical protein